MRFASLAPRCGTPPRVLPSSPAVAPSFVATGQPKPAPLASQPYACTPDSKPASDEWVQHARGCGAL